MAALVQRPHCRCHEYWGYSCQSLQHTIHIWNSRTARWFTRFEDLGPPWCHDLSFWMGLGSAVFAPLSKLVGRRPVYITVLTIFLLLLLPSALTQNIESILVSRFFGGFFTSALMSNSPASANDIISDKHRALAFGFWSIGPKIGLIYGPIIGGFVFQYLGWRWTNLIVLIIGSMVLVLIATVKETYASVILKRHAERNEWRHRTQTGGHIMMTVSVLRLHWESISRDLSWCS